MVAVLAASAGVARAADRAELRSAGGDRATALHVAQTLLAHPLDLQLTRVRCERAAGNAFCGLTLSDAEVDGLVRGAFATDASIVEVDLWVTVPANAGKGVVVSGDFALPSSATVFAASVPRAQRVPAHAGDGVFWDQTFRSELEQGSNG